MMKYVRLDIPEAQVPTLVQQLSPDVKYAIFWLLASELSAPGELEELEDWEDLEHYDEALDLWDLEEAWEEEVAMDRRQLLAAETYSYSYANYADHLGIGNVRFDVLMPNDVDSLERAEREGWDDARLAKALEIDEDNIEHWRQSYQRAKDIVDAPTPAEAFRRAVRYSIQYALEEGLNDEEDVELLVTQICYRAADLAYLLDLEESILSDYSQELRKTTEYDLERTRLWLVREDQDDDTSDE